MKTGLSEEEVNASRKEHGSNEITSRKKDSFIKLLISTLGDPMIKILLIALAVKTLFLFQDFDWYETVGIVIAIFFASFISSMSEYGSQKAFERIQEEASMINSRVRRSGQTKAVCINDIVVSDIVCLESGEQVPADGTLISGKIVVSEASLTGEMKEIKKSKGDKIYRSSVIYSGQGNMEVSAVGDKTLYGSLAKQIGEKTPDSPLKIRLTHLAGQISKLGYLGAALVSFSYLFSAIIINNEFNIDLIISDITNLPLMFSHLLHALTLSVTIIVVAVPEGLPMMITLVLSSNMRRMLKDNVLVRKLMGIETAGNINILFTDKTGTITKGKLEVIGVCDVFGKIYHSEDELSKSNIYEIMKLCMVANNSSQHSTSGAVGGNVTDKALLDFFKNDIPCEKIKFSPFSSEKKYSMAKVRYKGEEINLLKGAPEVILNKCSYCLENSKKSYFVRKSRVKELINSAAKKGIRVIALAIGNINNPVFVGLVYIKDEVRKEASDGVNLIKNAGIDVVMLTGDNVLTAKQIGKEIGLICNDNDLIITSDVLENMSDSEIKDVLPNLKIVARSLPSDKSRLIKIAQSKNLVVGMTGDGVNDAPALKKADVGFAMGSGTEVAKEASDVIILDDNLLSISNAVLYGRTIFKSIRKFIIFQLTVNLCAVGISIIGPFIGIDSPVTVVQMLWINMVMDTLAGIAFSFEPALKDYMKEKPIKKDEMIINGYMLGEIMITGVFSALLCVWFLKSAFVKNIFGGDDLLTAFFGLFIFMSIFNCFNARTHRLNLFSNIRKNKVFIIIIGFIILVQVYLLYYGGDLFRAYGLSASEFEIMILFSSLVVPVDWIRKLILRKKGKVGGV